MISKYDKSGLDSEAKSACKGKGKFIRWELVIQTEHGINYSFTTDVCLLVFYRDKDGTEQTTNVTI